MSNLPDQDVWMRRALELARQGWATASPNPMVGAVVLDAHGQVVGEGFHHHAGGPHAEVGALEQAGSAARGGTLFVTLEPCCHWGRTGPCTERVLASGVRHVVIGAADPNPKVGGRGIQQLREAGVTVEVGCLSEECLRLNDRFFYNMTRQLPWVSAKLALSLDGKLATRQGDSQWITNEAARAWVHDQRAGCDALLTTADTVLRDDPQLTVRSTQWHRLTPPIRLILDRRGRLDPARFQIFDTQVAPTWWIVAPTCQLSAQQATVANERGVRVVRQPWRWDGIDGLALRRWLFAQGIGSLWLEAGGRLVGHWLAQGWISQMHLMYGPVWIGDTQAPGLHRPDWPSQLADAARFQLVEHQHFGDNWRVTLEPADTSVWRNGLASRFPD